LSTMLEERACSSRPGTTTRTRRMSYRRMSRRRRTLSSLVARRRRASQSQGRPEACRTTCLTSRSISTRTTSPSRRQTQRPFDDWTSRQPRTRTRQTRTSRRSRPRTCTRPDWRSSTSTGTTFTPSTCTRSSRACSSKETRAREEAAHEARSSACGCTRPSLERNGWSARSRRGRPGRSSSRDEPRD
jgi:hypothetical protein